jgi:hypothetical protein
MVWEPRGHASFRHECLLDHNTDNIKTTACEDTCWDCQPSDGQFYCNLLEPPKPAVGSEVGNVGFVPNNQRIIRDLRCGF